MSLAEKRRIGWLAFLLIISIPIIVAFSESDRPIDQIFDHELYQTYMAQEVVSLPDLAGEFNCQQDLWLSIAPPAPDYILHQSAGLQVFNPKDFPVAFVNGLIPQINDGVTVYPITVYEDPKSRADIFLNANGDKIGEVPCQPGYSPDWFLLTLMPDLYYSGFSYWEIEWYKQIYDPARIVITFDLIEKDELVKYIIRESLKIEQAEKEARKNPGDIIIMRA